MFDLSDDGEGDDDDDEDGEDEDDDDIGHALAQGGRMAQRESQCPCLVASCTCLLPVAAVFPVGLPQVLIAALSCSHFHFGPSFTIVVEISLGADAVAALLWLLFSKHSQLNKRSSPCTACVAGV